jgi:histidinol dehydrogenase
MNITINPPRSDWERLISRPVILLEEIERRVEPIMNDVAARGDAALREYVQKFDGAEINDIFASEAEFERAETLVSDELKSAIALAKRNIERFHRAQIQEPQYIETSPGVVCWRKSVPIESVGLYIPGGTAPLFSTVLMLGVPAEIVGTPSRVICTPPQADGSAHPAILYAAALVGIRRVAKIGGAQAIAAMTYGTESVPKAHKIFGPGNQYVTAAKQIAQRRGVAIDMPAGPSELAVIADASARPNFVAADLLSQAEHGADSQVLLIATDEDLARAVVEEIARQTPELPRAAIAEQALANSRVLVFSSLDEAVDFANFYAAEHLIIASDAADDVAARVTTAGSVFLGHFSPESAGDYASGTNHTLPTNGAARAYSGVSLDSFVKKITFQRLSPEGVASIGEAVEIMAQAEGLMAHSHAVSLRKQAIVAEKSVNA